MSMNKIKAPAYDVSFVPISGTTTSSGNLEISTSVVPITSYIVGMDLGASSYAYVGKGSSGSYYLHVTNSSGSGRSSVSISGTLIVLTPRS